MIRTSIRLFVLLSLSISCAVPVPPSGGPEDKVPPFITSTIPADESTSVDVTSKITLYFSEKMMSAKIERLVRSYPPIEIGKVKWHKETLTIEPARPLINDTTYVVTIKPGFKDQHGVSNKKGYSFAFATSAKIDSGVISGIVYFRRKPTNKAVIRCFRLPVDSGFHVEASKPDREVTTNEKGEYSFPYLPSDQARFIVWAFQDKNGNGVLEKGKEYGALYPDTIYLGPESSKRGGADIIIVDPTEPGEIEGSIVNHTGIDTIPVSAALCSLEDSVEVVSHYTLCDPSSGSFHFKNVLRGSYILRGFMDIKRDSLCSTYRCFGDTTEMCIEPCVQYPDSIRLKPGESLGLEPLILKKAQKDKDEN